MNESHFAIYQSNLRSLADSKAGFTHQTEIADCYTEGSSQPVDGAS
jgi:hypothetical protein